MNRLLFSVFILSISRLNKRIFFEMVFLIRTSSIIDTHIIWAIWLVLRVMQPYVGDGPVVRVTLIHYPWFDIVLKSMARNFMIHSF